MSKYIIRNKDSSGFITYIYRKGFRARVKPNYERFLNDVMRYASSTEGDIETTDDLINLFERAKDRGADFHESTNGRQALIDEWNKRGNKLDVVKEDVNVKEALDLTDKLSRRLNRTEMKKLRRGLSKAEKGRRISREESRILFKIF